MSIRWMQIQDLDQIMIIEALAFKTPWLRASFENELLMNNLARYFVYEVDGAIAGYVGFWHIVDEGHITNVAVHPDYRRRGIAKALIAHMMAYALSEGIGALTLEVRVSNQEAISLYEGFGFVGQGVRPKYYQDTNEDALIMWAPLTDNTHQEEMP